jgi:hypothetical protein
VDVPDLGIGIPVAVRAVGIPQADGYPTDRCEHENDCQNGGAVAAVLVVGGADHRVRHKRPLHDPRALGESAVDHGDILGGACKTRATPSDDDVKGVA